MPKGGSRKGEHRGNAKRRPQETPGDVMRETLTTAQPRRHRANRVLRTDRRLQAARTFHGPPHDVRDLTPREVLLSNMHFFTQAAFDWQAHLMTLAAQPLTKDTAEAIAEARREIERYRNLASEDAYKVAPYLHPRLAAVVVGGNAGESTPDIVRILLDDIDNRQRALPPPASQAGPAE